MAPNVVLAIALLANGCGFSVTPAGQPAPDAIGTDGLATDAPPSDGPPASPHLFACDPTTLYRIDLVGRAAVAIGPIRQGAGAAIYLEGLTFHKGRLWGLPFDTDEKLYEIDPATAQITNLTDLADNRNYFGMTAIPVSPGPAMLVAATDAGELYQVDGPTPRLIGSFGGGLRIAGDLTWASGVGLIGTLQGGACDGCIAKISHLDAMVTILSSTAPNDLWAIAAFNGGVYALGGSGDVYSIDPTTGEDTWLFDTDVAYSDAAP